MSQPIIDVKDIQFAYGKRKVLNGISLNIEPGECVALVGPNGSGKTTLMQAILGLLPVQSGTIHLNGKALSSLTRKQIAQSAALLPQDSLPGFEFSAQAIVAMGRNPYLGRFSTETTKDLEIIQWALKATSSDQLADRMVSELSGGEQQRVMIARALAQQTDAILLDEPTSSLDVQHQLEILELIKNLVKENRCVLTALHDLNQAARFCSRVLMISEGNLVADGTPETVFTKENLKRYFHIEARITKDEHDGTLFIYPVASA